MMITWGKSMMITALLMVPLQEQRPLMCNPGWIRRQTRNPGFILALVLRWSSDSVRLERKPRGKQTNMQDKRDICSYMCLFQHDTVQGKREAKAHCLFQPEWIQSSAGESGSAAVNYSRKEGKAREWSTGMSMDAALLWASSRWKTHWR